MREPLGVPAQKPQHARAEQGTRRPLAARGERLREDGPSLGDVAARGPEPPERHGEPQPQAGVRVLTGPVERAAEIAALLVEAVENGGVLAGA